MSSLKQWEIIADKIHAGGVLGAIAVQSHATAGVGSWVPIAKVTATLSF